MVVDDDKLLRYGLERILESADDIRVSVTCDGLEAVDLAVRHRPQVALVDIYMPDVSGLEVLAALRELDDPPVVAMLTGFGTDENVARALAAGAAGFFLKDTAAQELIPGVRLLAAGGSALSSRITHSVARSFARTVPDGFGPRAQAGAPLTERERDVLELLPTGMTNGEIAERLFLSRCTVKDHVSSLLAKLGAANRVQAAVLAESVRAGYGGTDRASRGETSAERS
ncbi:response regulator [Streptomyces sp. NPDC059008]|uniref:response regulator n=1 Tax=Streptomyces sp. NPDC059008 TaxID=3346693 RepID=UPI0036C8C874